MRAFFVLDAGPLIDFLNDKPDGERVGELLADPNFIVLAHALNLAEVFYDTSRQLGISIAREALESFKRDGLIRREDMDIPFMEDAAQLKADWKRVSLADCCGVALARRLGAQFVTTDRHELQILADNGVADVHFTR